MHFRFQVPIRDFIVDFACHRVRLAIEADGGQHATARDSKRNRLIEAQGYRLLRFWNNNILANGDGVMSVVADALVDRHPHPSPPPSRGRGF